MYDRTSDRTSENFTANDAYSASLVKILNSYVGFSDQKRALLSKHVPNELKTALIEAIQRSSGQDITYLCVLCNDIQKYSTEQLFWQGIASQLIEMCTPPDTSAFLKDVSTRLRKRLSAINDKDISMFILKSQYERSNTSNPIEEDTRLAKIMNFIGGHDQPNPHSSIFSHSLENITRYTVLGFFDYVMIRLDSLIEESTCDENSDKEKKIVVDFLQQQTKQDDWKGKLKNLNLQHNMFDDENGSSKSSSITSLDTVIMKPDVSKQHKIEEDIVGAEGGVCVEDGGTRAEYTKTLTDKLLYESYSDDTSKTKNMEFLLGMVSDESDSESENINSDSEHLVKDAVDYKYTDTTDDDEVSCSADNCYEMKNLVHQDDEMKNLVHQDDEMKNLVHQDEDGQGVVNHKGEETGEEAASYTDSCIATSGWDYNLFSTTSIGKGDSINNNTRESGTGVLSDGVEENCESDCGTSASTKNDLTNSNNDSGLGKENETNFETSNVNEETHYIQHDSPNNTDSDNDSGLGKENESDLETSNINEETHCIQHDFSNNTESDNDSGLSKENESDLETSDVNEETYCIQHDFPNNPDSDSGSDKEDELSDDDVIINYLE